MIRTFIDSDMFLLTLTVGLYCGGVALHHRLRLAILHPTLLAFVALILFLKVCGIDYGHYRQPPKFSTSCWACRSSRWDT